MNITIYNANDVDAAPDLDRRAEALAKELQKDHDVESVRLRDLDIKYCNGCWGCWVKEPGRCVTRDDMPVVHESFINADLVIFVSPMRMGFPNALTKKVQDKLIPLVHPYITLVIGESHHEARYAHYPKWGLILEPEPDTDDTDLELVHALYRRTTLNIKSELLFTHSCNTPLNTIADEINRL